MSSVQCDRGTPFPFDSQDSAQGAGLLGRAPQIYWKKVYGMLKTVSVVKRRGKTFRSAISTPHITTPSPHSAAMLLLIPFLMRSSRRRPIILLDILAVQMFHLGVLGVGIATSLSQLVSGRPPW